MSQKALATDSYEKWKVKTLAECCVIKGEYGINAAAVDYSKDLPTYIRITDIDDDGNYSAGKKVSVDDEKSENYILTHGDILFARTGATVGKTYLYNENDGELVFAGFLIRFRPNQDILLPEYLKNFTGTKPYWDWVKTISMRSGQPGINAEEYGSLRFPIPAIIEQKAISSFLNAWDKAIERTTQLIAAKEQRKKWLMQQLLTGKKRLKAFEKQKWVKLRLGELLEETKRPVTWNDKELYDLAIIKRWALGMERRKALLGSQIEVKKLFIVKENDFLISQIQAAYGAVGLVTREFEGAKVSDLYTVLTPKKPHKILPHYLEQYSKTRFFWNMCMLACNGFMAERIRLNFQPEEFLKQRMELPSTLEEQSAIVNVLQTADKEITLLKQKLEAYKEQKKGLMQMLLTGKVRLNRNRKT